MPQETRRVLRRPPRAKRRFSAAHTTSYTCPFCFERIVIPVDTGNGDFQILSIDCQVCCRPSSITISRDEDGHRWAATAERE